MGRAHPGASVVLVVEDERQLLDVVAEELEDAGFAAIRALTGDHALDVLNGPAVVDVLFTDIRLPGAVDGWQLAEKARAMRPTLPVIYATGYTKDPPRQMNGGVLFAKPYRLSAIVDAVRALKP